VLDQQPNKSYRAGPAQSPDKWNVFIFS
jgi:hypothetical protein